MDRQQLLAAAPPARRSSCRRPRSSRVGRLPPLRHRPRRSSRPTPLRRHPARIPRSGSAPGSDGCSRGHRESRAGASAGSSRGRPPGPCSPATVPMKPSGRMPAARAAIASCCFGINSASAVGSMPIVNAKSSPPSVSATMRRSRLGDLPHLEPGIRRARSSRWKRGAHPPSCRVRQLELAHDLGDQA